MSIAVISLGGKQYTVEPGKIINVSRFSAQVGAVLERPDLLGDKTVSVKVLEHKVGHKCHGIKFHNKTRYIRHYGFRNQETQVEVVKVS